MAKSRAIKTEWIKERLEHFFKKNKNGSISKKKLVAMFALETSSSKRTGDEIVGLLNDTDFIILEGDSITR